MDSTYITSRYGERSAPTAGASTNHKAIDIGAKSGDPIYAAADGQVASATYNNGLGYYVSIEHDGETATRYSHMTNYIVQPGEQVKQGQIIGYVGESGIATGSHTHIHHFSLLIRAASFLQSHFFVWLAW